MKPLNCYGRPKPFNTDGIEDKWAGDIPDMDHVKPKSPPERPAVHPHICESGKWRAPKFH